MVYKETPELEKIMPKKTSKILNTAIQKTTKESKTEEPAIFTGKQMHQKLIFSFVEIVIIFYQNS